MTILLLILICKLSLNLRPKCTAVRINMLYEFKLRQSRENMRLNFAEHRIRDSADTLSALG